MLQAKTDFRVRMMFLTSFLVFAVSMMLSAEPIRLVVNEGDTLINPAASIPTSAPAHLVNPAVPVSRFTVPVVGTKSTSPARSRFSSQPMPAAQSTRATLSEAPVPNSGAVLRVTTPLKSTTPKPAVKSENPLKIFRIHDGQKPTATAPLKSAVKTTTSPPTKPTLSSSTPASRFSAGETATEKPTPVVQPAPAIKPVPADKPAVVDNPAVVPTNPSRFSTPTLKPNKTTTAMPVLTTKKSPPKIKVVPLEAKAKAGETIKPVSKVPAVVPANSAKAESNTPKIARTSPPAKVVIKPEEVKFMLNQLQIGKATLVEIQSRWGKSEHVNQLSNKTVHSYKLPNFQRVEFGIQSGKLDSIFAVLEKPIYPDEIGKFLKLENARPADVRDESGLILGKVFPEQGIVLSYAASSKSNMVESIILSKPSAEGYMIRALATPNSKMQQKIEDLNQILAMEQYHAAAWSELSDILLRTGQYTKALDAAQKASSGIGSLPEYRLQVALLAAEVGSYDRAVGTTRRIVEDETLPTLVRAKASLLLGDLLHGGPAEVADKAMEFHLEAVRLAGENLQSSETKTRRAAKQVMVDAHLALAVDIATGDWEQKEITVPKWLSRAKVFADDMIAQEGASSELRMRVLQKSLVAYSYYDQSYDPGETVDSILSLGRELISRTDDSLYQSTLQWEMGQSLAQAVFIEQSRDENDSALRIARDASVLLEAQAEDREMTVADILLAGNLHQRIGSIYAVAKNDHLEAVRWYEKSLPWLTHKKVELINSGQRGELLVSFGVSYWESGNKDKAVELTEQGAAIMKKASEESNFPTKNLLVPYANLATMHKHLGNGAESTKFTQLAQKIQSNSSTR
ncbi:MAG: hypothetical protein COA78_13790 [Blastopirellula sp.]|nr:MAG: hypothetical protein COA78_13790 [Blastopirellula sp.]